MAEQNQSLYFNYVEKYFEGIVTDVVENINGSQDPENVRYRHREMLTPTFSPSGLWETAAIFNTRAAASFVAMDSPLPIYKRDRMTKRMGEIVKSGMELSLNERQITDINTILNMRNVPEREVVRRLFQDTPKVIYGEYELMELAFLQGLSTGVCLIEDYDNKGIGVRLDYGYLDENKFEAHTAWSDHENAKPLDDLKEMVKKAKKYGRNIAVMMMDETTFDHLCECKQVKEWLAWKMNFVGNISYVGTPDYDDLSRRFAADSRYGFTIEKVDRTVLLERDGEQTAKKPWASGMVIGIPTRNIGTLVWSELAEAQNPVAGVSYQNAGEGILVSKFSTNRPFKEYTTSQARMVPVIGNVESIYQLNALPETNEDEPIDLDDDDDDDGGGTGTGS